MGADSDSDTSEEKQAEEAEGGDLENGAEVEAEAEVEVEEEKDEATKLAELYDNESGYYAEDGELPVNIHKIYISCPTLPPHTLPPYHTSSPYHTTIGNWIDYAAEGPRGSNIRAWEDEEHEAFHYGVVHDYDYTQVT